MGLVKLCIFLVYLYNLLYEIFMMTSGQNLKRIFYYEKNLIVNKTKTIIYCVIKFNAKITAKNINFNVCIKSLN